VAPPVVNPGNPTTFFTATYEWANLKAGTYLIASGSHPAVQLPMGLYAALKVDVVAGLQAYPNATTTSYANDVVLLLSEVDPALNAAVVGGDYGTSVYPTSISMGYLPRYFLINGTSYSTGVSAPLPVVTVDRTTLLRFLNAGSRTRNPVFQGPFMTLVAEDGNPSSYPQQQYSINLPAGKTMDATFQPTVQGALTLYDRSLGLTNNTTSPGGMLVNLTVASVGVIGTFDNGTWYLDFNGNGVLDGVGGGDTQATFGTSSMTPVTGDWNGNGITTIGAFDNGTWYLDVNGNGVWDGVGGGDAQSLFGTSGMTPVTGDWNDNGTTTIGAFDNGTWYLDVNGNGVWDGVGGADLLSRLKGN
jgi:hypothetical protein